MISKQLYKSLYHKYSTNSDDIIDDMYIGFLSTINKPQVILDLIRWAGYNAYVFHIKNYAGWDISVDFSNGFHPKYFLKDFESYENKDKDGEIFNKAIIDACEYMIQEINKVCD